MAVPSEPMATMPMDCPPWTGCRNDGKLTLNRAGGPEYRRVRSLVVTRRGLDSGATDSESETWQCGF